MGPLVLPIVVTAGLLAVGAQLIRRRQKRSKAPIPRRSHGAELTTVEATASRDSFDETPGWAIDDACFAGVGFEMFVFATFGPSREGWPKTALSIFTKPLGGDDGPWELLARVSLPDAALRVNNVTVRGDARVLFAFGDTPFEAARSGAVLFDFVARPGKLAYRALRGGVSVTVGGVPAVFRSGTGFLERIEDFASAKALRLTLGMSSSARLDLRAVPGLAVLDASDSQLRDLEDLESLRHLEALYLRGQAGLAASLSRLLQRGKLLSLRRVDLARCELGDLSFLPAALELTDLVLSDNVGLATLQPLARFSRSLRWLAAGGCAGLSDIAEVTALRGLRALDLSGVPAVRNLEWASQLEELEDLVLRSTPIHSVDGLKRCAALATIDLSGSTALRDIGGLAGLPKLERVVLRDCPELTPDAWSPLASLPSLRWLEGPFTRSFAVRTLANAAASRADVAYVAEHLDEWLSVVRAEPEACALLSALGASAALLDLEFGAAVFAELIGLAATHDAPEVEGLFRVIGCLPKMSEVEEALNKARAQESGPLPPETLAAIDKYIPGRNDLRDRTLLALARTAKTLSPPAWSVRTARALRLHLDDHTRYEPTRVVHDEVLATITAPGARDVDDLSADLFASLAGDHSRVDDDAWVTAFHERLLDVAIDQPHDSARNGALAALASGLAVARDQDWALVRLDSLLQRAAEISPDTSSVHSAVACAHAVAGRWQAAEDGAFRVLDERVRDPLLVELARTVIRADVEDRAMRAVSLLGGIESASLRREELERLASTDMLLEDAVAYGQVLALLADAPSALTRVATKAISTHPNLAFTNSLDADVAVTARERRLVAADRAKERQMLLDALRSTAPGLEEPILRYLSERTVE
jgi:hypothetical protein